MFYIFFSSELHVSNTILTFLFSVINISQFRPFVSKMWDVRKVTIMFFLILWQKLASIHSLKWASKVILQITVVCEWNKYAWCILLVKTFSMIYDNMIQVIIFWFLLS